jgi:hypothetical protein
MLAAIVKEKVPAGTSDERAAYLANASDRFTQAWTVVETHMGAAFPDAEKAFFNGLPGWRIPLPKNVEPPAGWGTMPPHSAWVFLADRKAGPVLHLWNPMDYYWLDAHRTRLAPRGLKVMRGCVQYGRKAPTRARRWPTF